jgi:hypothetical protein
MAREPNTPPEPMPREPEAATDPTEALIRRLARPHPSGGVVIERSVILAEGTRSAAILSWISGHDGVADSTTPTSSRGLHGRAASDPRPDAPPRRFVLPRHAFATVPPRAPRRPAT